uniref:Uncharacterized protein n=1 Tax=Oryza sativa subsp. japonica TaxID=39947 RepID=Q6YSX9_ORYSJ|nr:hypothetical protein [Oryza sativa Japonica Group]BAC84761.1 hypothetical protein [Oryza sativa Japonica Group]
MPCSPSSQAAFLVSYTRACLEAVWACGAKAAEHARHAHNIHDPLGAAEHHAWCAPRASFMPRAAPSALTSDEVRKL